MSFQESSSAVRHLTSCIVVGLTVAATGPSAQAAFHLWNLTQLYSNSSGTLQFVELSTTSSGQGSVGGHQLTFENVGDTKSNIFTIPSGGSFQTDTANKTFLIGTAGLAAAGGPTPDFIMPDNFLFTGGGSLFFFGANGGSYSAMPTDGIDALQWPGPGTELNGPVNFAGQAGFVTPEPTTFALGLFGGACLFFLALRRRRLAAAQL